MYRFYTLVLFLYNENSSSRESSFFSQKLFKFNNIYGNSYDNVSGNGSDYRMIVVLVVAI
jgi:hypothetical protein